MRVRALKPAFVPDIPEVLEHGVLYVALEYDAMAHLCACGCGSEVATPIGPSDWRIAWDGVGITVRPSVGSGSLPCRSHYLIDGGRIDWCRPMSDRDIAAERLQTAAAKGHAPPFTQPKPAMVETPAAELPTIPAPWLMRAWQWLIGR